MSTPWFFLSYASISERNDKQVEGFSSDLVDALRIEASLRENEVPAGHIGFCAPTEMAAGANWPKELAEKLRTCRVLVCLYSDSYFESAACGKEFKIFSSRLDAYAATLAGVPSPPLIVPVLWTIPTGFPSSLPRAASDLHYDNPYLDKLLHARGLFYLRTLASHKTEYDEYVVHLARTIKTVAEQHPLPPLAMVPPFHKAWNAWVDPPAPPGAVEATLTAPRQISLSWADNSTDESGFYVERFRYGGRADFIKLKELRADSVGCTDTRVAPGTKYRYRVCAYNSGGCSDYVETDDVETPGQPPPPMPSDLSGSALSPREIELRWVDNSDGKGSFKIERCDDPDRGSFKQVGAAQPGEVVYKDGGLTPTTTHIYRVCASDASGDSDYSDEVAVSTPKPRPPIPILLLLLITAAVVVAAVPGFRCTIIPPLCAPTPTPPRPTLTPPIRKTYWSDGFKNMGSDAEPRWQLGVEWDTPGWQPQWPLNNTDGGLIVQGITPGVVKAHYFDDFEMIFPIEFEAGTKAGWLVRAQGDPTSGYRGYCFVLESRPDAFYLIGYWGSPQNMPTDTPPTPQLIPITQYKKGKDEHKNNDTINVWVSVAQDKVFMVFRLRNPDKDRQKELGECFTATAHVGTGHPAAGYVGLFAGDDVSRFRVGAVEVNPITPEAKRLVKCDSPGPVFDIR